MRKIFASLIVFMLLSMFSGAVFAGQIDVCEDIKNDPAYKGLYGLCNAYWNADSEEAKNSILKAFKKKADPLGLSMPGLDSFACPCWSGLTKKEICDMGDGDPFYIGDDSDGYVIRSIEGSTVSDWLVAFSSANYCAHAMFEDGKAAVYLEESFDLTDAEAKSCVEDLQDMDIIGYCDP